MNLPSCLAFNNRRARESNSDRPVSQLGNLTYSTSHPNFNFSFYSKCFYSILHSLFILIIDFMHIKQVVIFKWQLVLTNLNRPIKLLYNIRFLNINDKIVIEAKISFENILWLIKMSFSYISSLLSY
jgi:hypothetical protein